MAREVVCIETDDSSTYEDCRSITSIGFEIDTVRMGGSKTPAEVHDDIDAEGRQYYIVEKGAKTDLVPATDRGTKYVRTESNDTEHDNLLNQPEC